MDFNEWLQTLPGAPLPTQAAREAKLSNATLLRHAEKGETTADNVIAIARAYGVAPVDALVATGHLDAHEASSARLDIRMALKGADIEELWNAMAEKVDGSRILVERFPRFSDLEISIATDEHSSATPAPSSPPTEVKKPTTEAEEPDYDALIERINSGEEKVAAQKRTPPLEENFT